MRTDVNVSDKYAAERPCSQQLFQRARRVLAGGAGHDLRYCHPMPIYIDRAFGSRKWDIDGHEYVDFLMGNGALLLGHAVPEVIAAIRDVAGRGTHFGNDHRLHIEWAERVQQLIPSAERVRFVNSGTEATQLAIRVARAFTRRNKLLRFEGHFHGWHDEVVHGFQLPFEAEGSLGVPPELRARWTMIPDGDLALVDETLGRQTDIAAVLLEPSGGSWGRQPLSSDFLHSLREITKRRGVLLIFDEVITGFRFSPGGAQALYGVTPDLTCLAKIVAGGMPGGAIVGRADVMSVFEFTGDARHDRFQRVTHQGTFNGAPLSAAAGIVTLDLVASGEPIRRANTMAKTLRDSWNEVLERHGIAGYVYGDCSTFHVYFETDAARVQQARSRQDLFTSESRRLKGMPGELIAQYQRHLRHFGVDIMSSTGGVLSAAHDGEDIRQATVAFEHTVKALRDLGLISCLARNTSLA